MVLRVSVRTINESRSLAAAKASIIDGMPKCQYHTAPVVPTDCLVPESMVPMKGPDSTVPAEPVERPDTG